MLVTILACAFLTHYVVTIRGLRARDQQVVNKVNELMLQMQDRQTLEDERNHAEDTSFIRTGDMAPPMEFTTLDGRVIRLEDLRGRVVLLNFFSTWCGPCRQELPRLQTDIWERFGSKGLLLLAVSMDNRDTPETIREWTKECTFSVATDPKGIYKQLATSVPRCYLITPEGRIRFMTCGFGKILEPEFQRLVNVIDLELQRTSVATQPAERAISLVR